MPQVYAVLSGIQEARFSNCTTTVKPLRSGQDRSAQPSQTANHPRENQTLLQLRVLCFCFLQNGDVGIGVLPEGEEIPIRLTRGSLVAHRRLRAAEL
jgi:hypothetical protein